MKATTVLVVDDFDDCREMICRLLQALGYRTIGVGSPSTALDRLTGFYEEESVILLTDVNLPSMNGVELSVEVMKRRPGCPVIYISGDSYDVLTAKGLVDSDDIFLEKPFTLASLKSALGRVRASILPPLMSASV